MAPSAIARGKRKREDTPEATHIITFVAPQRQLAFDRLLDASNLIELKNLAREKLALPSDAKFDLVIIRNDDKIPIEDEKDFAAFAANARLCHHSRIRINIVESVNHDMTDGEQPRSKAPVSKKRKLTSQSIDSSNGNTSQASTSRAQTSVSTTLPLRSTPVSPAIPAHTSTSEKHQDATVQGVGTARDDTVELDAAVPPADELAHATVDSSAAIEPSLEGKNTDRKHSIKSKGKKAHMQVEEPIASGSGSALPVNHPPPTIDLAHPTPGTDEQTDAHLPDNGDLTPALLSVTSTIDRVAESGGATKKRKKQKKNADVDSPVAPRKDKKRQDSAQGIAGGDHSVVDGSLGRQANGSGAVELSEHEEGPADAKPTKRKRKTPVVTAAQSSLTRQAMKEALESINTSHGLTPHDDSSAPGEAGTEDFTSVTHPILDPHDHEDEQHEQRQKSSGAKKTSRKPKSKQPVAADPADPSCEVPTIPSADPTDQQPDVSDPLVAAAPHTEKAKHVKKKSKKIAGERKAKFKTPKSVIPTASRESEPLGLGDLEKEDAGQVALLPDLQEPTIVTHGLVRSSSPCLDSIRRTRKFVFPASSLPKARAPEPNWAALAAGFSSAATATADKPSLLVETPTSSVAVASTLAHDQELEKNSGESGPGKPAKVLRRRFSSIGVENTDKSNPEEEIWEVGLRSPRVEIMPAHFGKQKLVLPRRPATAISQQSSPDADGGSTTAVQNQSYKRRIEPRGLDVRRESPIASVHSSDGRARSTLPAEDAKASKIVGEGDEGIGRATAALDSRARSETPLDLLVAATPQDNEVEPKESDEDKQQDEEWGDGVEDDDAVGGEVLVPASQLASGATGETNLNGFALVETNSAPVNFQKPSGHRQRPSIPGWIPILDSPQSALAVPSTDSLVDPLPSDSEGEESDEAVIDESLKASSPLKSPSSRRSLGSDTDSDGEDSRRVQPSSKMPPPKSLPSRATGTKAMPVSVPFSNGIHGVRPGHGLQTSLQNNSKTPLPVSMLRGGLSRTQSASLYPSLNGLVFKRQSASQPTTTQRAPSRTPAQKSLPPKPNEDDSDDSNSGSSDEDDDDAVPKNRRAGAGLHQPKQHRSRLSLFE